MWGADFIIYIYIIIYIYFYQTLTRLSIVVKQLYSKRTQGKTENDEIQPLHIRTSQRTKPTLVFHKALQHLTHSPVIKPESDYTGFHFT